MDDAAAVGVAESVGDLANEIDPEVQGEGCAVLLEVMVEADLARLVAKEDGWADSCSVKVWASRMWSWRRLLRMSYSLSAILWTTPGIDGEAGGR